MKKLFSLIFSLIQSFYLITARARVCVCVCCLPTFRLYSVFACVCVYACWPQNMLTLRSPPPPPPPPPPLHITKCIWMVTLSGWLLNLPLGETPPPSLDIRWHQTWWTLKCMFSLPPEGDALIQEISPKFNYSWMAWWWTPPYKSVRPTRLFITATIYGECVAAGRDEPVKT